MTIHSIEIHIDKAADWLVSRRHVPDGWGKLLSLTKYKLKQAMRLLNDHRDTLGDDFYNEVVPLPMCKRLNSIKNLDVDDKVELILESDAKQLVDNLLKRPAFAEQSSILTGSSYLHPLTSAWYNALKSFSDTAGLNLANAALTLQRLVRFEVPAAKRAIQSNEKSLDQTITKKEETLKQACDARTKFRTQTGNLGLTIDEDAMSANDLKRIRGDLTTQMMRKIACLDDVLAPLLEYIDKLNEPLVYHQSFCNFLGVSDGELLPMLAYLVKNGNVFVQEYRTGVKPSDEEVAKARKSRGEGNVAESEDDGEADIDWGDDGGICEIDEEMAVIEEVVEDAGVSADVTLLDYPDTRHTLRTELAQLQAFLAQRLSDLESPDSGLSVMIAAASLNSAPANVANADAAKLRQLLRDVEDFVGLFEGPNLANAIEYRYSSIALAKTVSGLMKYLETASKKDQMAGVMDELITDYERKSDVVNKTAKDLAIETVKLKKAVETQISAKYDNRPNNDFALMMNGFSSDKAQFCTFPKKPEPHRPITTTNWLEQGPSRQQQQHVPRTPIHQPHSQRRHFRSPPPNADLRDLAMKHQAALETQQQLLIAKEQRLKWLRRQAHEKKWINAENDKIEILRTNLAQQNIVLDATPNVAQIRDYVKNQKDTNESLSRELERVKGLFKQKEHELLDTVARVQKLTQHLNAYRHNRGGIDQPATRSVDHLRSQIASQKHLLQQHQLALKCKREIWARKRNESDALDRQIACLHTKLSRVRTETTPQEDTTNTTTTTTSPSGTQPVINFSDYPKLNSTPRNGRASTESPSLLVSTALAANHKTTIKDETVVVEKNTEPTKDHKIIDCNGVDDGSVHNKTNNGVVNREDNGISLSSPNENGAKENVDVTLTEEAGSPREHFDELASPDSATREDDSGGRDEVDAGHEECSSVSSLDEHVAPAVDTPPDSPTPVEIVSRFDPHAKPGRSIVRRRRPAVAKTGDARQTEVKQSVTFSPLTLLLDASLEGDLLLVAKTLQVIEDPSAQNDEGISSLHNAICADQQAVTRLLIDAGCNVNATDADGWTPLHCAASCNSMEIVQLLVQSGASVLAHTLSEGETPRDKIELGDEGGEDCCAFLTSEQDALGVQSPPDETSVAALVYAVCDLIACNADELSVKVNQPLRILTRGDTSEPDWWLAETMDQPPVSGYVPRTLISRYKQKIVSRREIIDMTESIIAQIGDDVEESVGLANSPHSDLLLPERQEATSSH